MITLFIDTSLSDVSIALLKDEKITSYIHENIPNKHSVYVIKYIDDVLKESHTSPKDINEIVVVNGPGSFTGIRIGVTIAKTFAYLQKIRIVTITSLLARAIGSSADYILSTIDAKHGNYYTGLYKREYQMITEEFAPENRVKILEEEYHPFIVTPESKEYDIPQIVHYCRQYPSQNPHTVNPIYLKLPEAMEKK